CPVRRRADCADRSSVCSSLGSMPWCVTAIAAMRRPAPKRRTKSFASPSAGLEKYAPNARTKTSRPLCPPSLRPHVPNQRLHVVQITLQLAPPFRPQPVLGARDPPPEGLTALDVAGLLQAARVHAEVAVRGVEQALEVVEAELVVDREGAHDAEAHALVDDPVQLDGAPAPGAGPARRSRRPGLLRRASRVLAPPSRHATVSHRASSR